jgi:hypothetical protein
VSIFESLEVDTCNDNWFFVFSYPAVYIFCMLPMSIARWIYFNGSTVPQQFTLFGSGLFSLCGLFDAILFFLTRPNLVVGTIDSPPLALATNTQSEHSGDVKLPFTQSPTASDYPPLDIESGRNSQFKLHNQILHPEGAGTISDNHRSPRGRRQSDLGKDKEAYGHLPFR